MRFHAGIVDMVVNNLHGGLGWRSLYMWPVSAWMTGSVRLPFRQNYLAMAAASLLFNGSAAFAQERVVGAKDSDALFHSSDPRLNADKQVACHIVKDILEGGNVEAMENYLTQHHL
jgi:hypothetical protein